METADVERYWFKKDLERAKIAHQPYRTTPLVMPGAKVKRDNPGVTSYLQKYPDPSMRVTPHQAPAVAAAQGVVAAANAAIAAASTQSAREKVFDPERGGWANDQVANDVMSAAEGKAFRDGREAADASKPQIVHKQYNSPISLYSQENVQQVLSEQTGLTPNVNRSAKKFSPAQSATYQAIVEEENKLPVLEHRPPQPKVYTIPVVQTGKTNSLGVPHEKINQSFTFKRVMAQVGMND